MSGFVRTETCPDETTANERVTALKAMGFDATAMQGVTGTALLVDVDATGVDQLTETVVTRRPAPWLVFAVLRG